MTSSLSAETRRAMALLARQVATYLLALPYRSDKRLNLADQLMLMALELEQEAKAKARQTDRAGSAQ